MSPEQSSRGLLGLSPENIALKAISAFEDEASKHQGKANYLAGETITKNSEILTEQSLAALDRQVATAIRAIIANYRHQKERILKP
jgi:hypothetical protein